MNFYKKGRREPKLEKLNLVPIMDAVFIFIFFLLFSAQFIKIYEIETDAPLVSEVPQENKQDKEPLNLTIRVLNEKIELRTGLDQQLYSSLDKSSNKFEKRMKDQLLDLRRKNPDDDYAILAPLAQIKYEEIVNLLDVIQTIPKKQKVVLKTKKGKKTLNKIFTQVVLEPLNIGE